MLFYTFRVTIQVFGLGLGIFSLEKRMPYSPPTLFGIAYASRLFQEIDNPSSYGEFVHITAPAPDLQNVAHCAELLKWLNKWGCRIHQDRFPELSLRLGQWVAQQEFHSLPQGIVLLSDSNLDQLASAYEGLRGCGLGPTAAAKCLFAVIPKCAIPWDEEIRTEFAVGEDGSGYRGMLKLSRDEGNMLQSDASRLGFADVFEAIGNPTFITLPKLLDEYHWITITTRHHIPSRDELEKWISWLA
jgi:hypothetical protein